MRTILTTIVILIALALELALVGHITETYGSFGEWITYVNDTSLAPTWLNTLLIAGISSIVPITSVGIILGLRK